MLIILAYEFWLVFATPGLVAIPDRLYSNSAGFVLLNVVISKNLYPLSGELNPLPPVIVLSVYCWIPSTNTFSPAANGAIANPKTGVVKVQVTIPVEGLYSALETERPLLLSTG